MYCPICGFQCPTAEEQERHEKNHTQEEREQFHREQERRRNELLEKQNKANSPTQQEITQFTKGPNYSKIYSTHWGLIRTQADVRIDLFNEMITRPSNLPMFPQVVEHIIEAQIVTPIQSAKVLSVQLKQLIEQHEAEFGEIIMQ